MIIFETTLAKGHEMLTCKTYEDIRTLASLDGTARKKGWTPPCVERGPANKRSGNKPAEIPYMCDTLIMRRSALDTLHDVLKAHGEILPVATEDGVELFVLNVLGVVDALDMNNSDIHRIEGTRAVSLRKLVFIESAIGKAEIFRIPVDSNRVFYTDRFVARVKAAKLKGTDFTPLWSSTDGPIG